MLWSRDAEFNSTFCLSPLNHLIQLISTVLMLDCKYVFFLFKEGKLLVGWLQPLPEMEEDQLSSSGLSRENGLAG